MTSSKTTRGTAAPRVRILAGSAIALGPGKADLLRAIDDTGSISAAARRMRMSYRRAWLLVHTMNQCFQSPLVAAEKGGTSGGGAQLTETGREVLRLYQEIVDLVTKRFSAHLRTSPSPRRRASSARGRARRAS